MASASKKSSAASTIIFVILILLASILMTYPPGSFAQMGMQEPPATTETITPSLLYDNTWKISNADGPADWSPTEDILVVSSMSVFEPRVMLYGANGTRLMTIAEFKQGEFISSARFNPNGSKIAFTHAMGLSSQLEIFDLNSRATQDFQFQGNFTDFDWMPDGNHIIYFMFHPNYFESDLPAYQLRIHDLRIGTETVIQDNITGLQYFDLSQDGTTLLIVQQVREEQPCENISIDGMCYTDDIVSLKLGQNNPGDNSTDLHSELTDNGTHIISSKVIWKGTPPSFITFPRWVLNDSAIVYSVGNVRCGGPMVAISPDGTRNQSLSSADETSRLGTCYENGGVFNRDGTIVAYAKSNGIQVANTNFNPVNTGLYLTFTELCKSKQCTPPTNTIPFVKGPAEIVTQHISQNGSPQYNMFLSVGYEMFTFGPYVDENTKTLSMTLQGPRAGDRIGERDVMLYLPSSLLNGDMTVLINGTQFFPASAESKDCLSTQTEEFCSKIEAHIDKIEGWSIVNITDNTTDNRSVVSIDIVGTTVTPELKLGIPALIITLFMTGAIVMQKIKAKQLNAWSSA